MDAELAGAATGGEGTLTVITGLGAELAGAATGGEETLTLIATAMVHSSQAILNTNLITRLAQIDI